MITRLKACYKPGELFETENQNNAILDDFYIVADYTPNNSTTGYYTETVVYKRVNKKGTGVRLLKLPALMVETQNAKTQEFDALSGEKYIFTVYLRKGYGNVTQTLKELTSASYPYKYPINSGITMGDVRISISESREAEHEYDGYVQLALLRAVLIKAWQSKLTTLYAATTTDMGIYYKTNPANEPVRVNTQARATAIIGKVKNFVSAALAAERQGGEPDEEIIRGITYYQLQYWLCGDGETLSQYLPADEAEAYCRANYAWCMPVEETTE